MTWSAETVEYWCGDCRDNRVFEVVPGGRRWDGSRVCLCHVRRRLHGGF